MSVATTRAIALVGVDGHLVDVEAHMSAQLPALTMVGLPDTAVNEARDRVRAAVTSTGISWPNRRITVNLSPASIPKSGTSFDLSIAMAILATIEVVNRERIGNVVHVGELGLGGRIRPVRGILPIVIAALARGHTTVMVPEANAAEAELIPGITVIPVSTLAGALRHYGVDIADPPSDGPSADTLVVTGDEPSQRHEAQDLCDVRGQVQARLALEIAAAGGHHLMMLGAPGTGKTMLATRLTTVLPDLDPEDAITATAIHSLAGTLHSHQSLITRPPFESPHHTATAAAIVGGGSGMAKPGAVSRAHAGVLFLDEAPEFSPRALETLRQPLEHGEVSIHRAHASTTYPARFQLILAANPCPCGFAVGRGLQCTCTALARRRYLSRLSGPLLDRVDLHVEVLPVTKLELHTTTEPESSAIIRDRVAEARDRQRHRLAATPWTINSRVPGKWFRVNHRLSAEAMRLLEKTVDNGTITLRGADRALRTAWTLADLRGLAQPGHDEMSLALSLRSRGVVR